MNSSSLVNKMPQTDHRLQKIGEEAFEMLEKKLSEQKKKAIPPNRQNHATGMLDRDAAKLYGGIQFVAFAPKIEG
ncbi:hypothetical protein RHGRI_003077 [Rhododendron griersonianum]|uniref:Uncharacterized protein n=1 Tax=Rhododendron griersonianum TaxID=479676 RepID=A0AAV6LSK5_9ERIC|nr:hypothetical protein RHGRI_003077 [Rhododendron griersonianum]